MSASEAHTVSAGRRRWITWPVAIMLLTAILFGTSAYITAQLLHVGGDIWNQYNFLRVDMPKPTCNPNPDINAEVAAKVKAAASQNNANSLFSSGPVNPKAVRASLLEQRDGCRQQFKLYAYNHKMVQSPFLRAYRSVELAMGQLNTIGQTGQIYLLILMILICSLAALFADEHIALRPPRSRLDHLFCDGSQALINLMMTAASVRWWLIDTGPSASQSPLLHWIWMAGFGVLTLACFWKLLRPSPKATPGGSLGHAVLCVPLYVALAFIAGVYFIFYERFIAELIVQILRMIAFSDLYLAVALYIWAGVLLKYTHLTERVFEVLRPWKLAPELITIAIVLVAAVPTAYTGASGIFVLALGGTIYNEIRVAGGRRQLAMGASAMSGSMGVVLNPCLMIVIISALNKQVTIDTLFYWGGWIFLLSFLIFSVFTLLNRRSPLTIASPRVALGPSLKALIPLIPYAVIAGIVIFAYTIVFNQPFNAFSAPYALPLMLIGIVFYERVIMPRLSKSTLAELPEHEVLPEHKGGFGEAMSKTTFDAAIPIGSLLLLMATSVAMGGAVERSGIMDLFPQHLGPIWAATAIITVTLVLIGMIIDPYGAIILVSSVIAGIAYRNGITPVHFWMITLVAFEVGYLMPPVMLNHLLARLAIGEDEYEKLADEPREPTFWRRHERVLLPLAVMCSSLVIVAFAPLVYGVLK